MKTITELLPELKELARQDRKANRKWANRIKKRPPRNLDAQVADLHEAAFEEIDCLECANCCKTTSPIIRDKDIDRMARQLRMRPAELVERYLHLDEDDDYVFKSAPCPFLGADNYCSIYEARPRACREYPHTDRKNFHQIVDLSVKNTAVCPAVYRILRQLRTVN
ncbi:MAG: YkgJ family cysteine cluster protein [Bacteroidota bacterium]